MAATHLIGESLPDTAPEARSQWVVVSGPVLAMVASAKRIVWEFESACVLIDDLGQSYDVRLDSPAAIAAAVRASVRWWRLAQVAEDLPPSMQAEPDLIAHRAHDTGSISRLLPVGTVFLHETLTKLVRGKRGKSDRMDLSEVLSP